MNNSLFVFEQGHVSITFVNGYRISMTNYSCAHCDYNSLRSDIHRSVSFNVEVMIFDPSMNDITKVFFKDASPDAGHIDSAGIAIIINKLRYYKDSFTKEDLE